jgi:tetratricopeptide (TPR) repeat protein
MAFGHPLLSFAALYDYLFFDSSRFHVTINLKHLSKKHDQLGGNYMTMETTLTIHHEKKHILLKPASLYVYQGFQVIEAFNMDQSECYYLYFYKASYLTGKCTSKIKRKSKLSTLLQKGIQLTNEHPFIAYLLTNNSVHTFPALTPLWEKIQKKYSSLEASAILTVFDSYMKKEKIIKVVKEFALKFRREGQLLHTYQLLRLLTEMYPSHKWAQEMSKNLQYQSYQALYTSPDTKTLLAKDPLYVEKYCWDHLDLKECRELLQQKLQNEGRQMEQLCLYTNRLLSSTEDDSEAYKQLLETLPSDTPNEDKINFLSYIMRHRTANHDKLNQHLLHLLKQSERYEDALLLLTKNNGVISASDFPYLLETVLNITSKSTAAWLSTLTFTFSEDVTPKQVQALFQLLIPAILDEKGLEYTHQWTEPFYSQYPAVPILLKIKRMALLKDDPDQMYALGELFYEFNQLSEAVECFNWELELDPTNVSTIKWLTKLYLEMGMVEESKSYQYMYHNLQKGG